MAASSSSSAAAAAAAAPDSSSGAALDAKEVAAKLKALSAASSAVSTPVVIKKTGFAAKGGAKKKNIRTQKVTTDQDDEVEKTNLEETKLLQKLRTRVKGVAAVLDDATAADVVEAAPAAAAAAAAASAAPGSLGTITGAGGLGNIDDSAAAQEKKLGLNVFQKEHSEKATVDIHQENWIREQLAKRRGKGARDDRHAKGIKSAVEADQKKADSAATWKASEEDLYKAPEILKASQMFKHTDQEMEESGERWLAGIAEVSLPISVKLKNIEETEAAKQRMLAERGKGQAIAALPTNFSTNFKFHKKQWDMEARASGRGDETRSDAAHGAGGGGGVGLAPADFDVRGMPPKRPRDDDFAAGASGAAAGRGGGGAGRGGGAGSRGGGAAGRGGGGGGRGGGMGPNGERVPHATDDRAMDRFIKRQRTRGR